MRASWPAPAMPTSYRPAAGELRSARAVAGWATDTASRYQRPRANPERPRGGW